MKTRYIIFTAILLALGFLLSPTAQAVIPAPDGGYPGGNTAEGQNALLSLTTGTYNTAVVGVFSLESDATGAFNTATGAGSLLVNTADQKHGCWRGHAIKQYYWCQQHSQRSVRAVYERGRQ